MSKKQKLTDKSLMPWGRYKGYNMENVPANYLLYMYSRGITDPLVSEYVVENMETLKLETGIK